ncbi:unnamed protein product, partial [Phaeothamnion confervicola]
MTWDDTPFEGPLRKALLSAGFPSPTPTQAQSWPIALNRRDLISVARTGSGKTCGFLLPAFHMLSASADALPPRMGAPPKVLVLAPTRELAMQIETEARKFGRASAIRSTCVYGGAPKYPQIKALEGGVEVLIATPGRLNDLVNMNKVNLSNVRYLVLDEADRMLDMGFEPQIRSIIEALPKARPAGTAAAASAAADAAAAAGKAAPPVPGPLTAATGRQTLFFTATWPKAVQRLAATFVTDPVSVTMGAADGALRANAMITQHVRVVTEGDKLDVLRNVLRETHPKVLIFTSRKRTCDKIAERLWNWGYAVDSLHGDREQRERTEVMRRFRGGELRVIVATDVAARGLDVRDVAAVINFDMGPVE